MPYIKMGIEENGKIVIPCEFDIIRPAIVDDKESTDIYVTEKNRLFGLAKVNDKCWTDNIYNYIGAFENSIAIVQKFSISSSIKYGFINTNLHECLECKYDEIRPLSNRFYLIRDNDKYGVFMVGRSKLYLPCDFAHITHEMDRVNSEIVKERFILDICLEKNNK